MARIFLIGICCVLAVACAKDDKDRVLIVGDNGGNGGSGAATGVSVNGTITAVGNPSVGMANQKVYLSCNGETWLSLTDANGAYSFANVPDGVCTVLPNTKGSIAVPRSRAVTVAGANLTVPAFSAAIVNNLLRDPWDFAWDGTVRGPMNHTNASALCESLGGRLPTPTEIYRNNAATKGGSIGDYRSTEWLWSVIQNNVSQHVVARLDNGSISYAADSDTGIHFRCVWPDREYDYFGGSSVYTDPGAGGFTHRGNLTLDRYDRAPLNYNAAVRECTFYHAHLAPQWLLTEAVQAGLPNGSGNWIMSSDHSGYNGTQFLTQGIRWTTEGAAYAGYFPSNATQVYMTSNTNFRCVGFNFKPDLHPRTIPDEWTASTSYLKSTAHDADENDDGDNDPADPDQVPYRTALDRCRAKGGLPNGTNALLWAADHTWGSRTITMRWSGIDTAFTGFYSTYLDWSFYNDSTVYQYRCVYYPLNENLSAPTACNGGCWQSQAINGGVTVNTWIDTSDRTADEYAHALKDCYDSGGRLPSTRDMVELIRAGLPNGNGTTYLWTTDWAGGGYATTVRWNGVETNFNISSGLSQDIPSATLMLPYRCLWTNELRLR